MSIRSGRRWVVVLALALAALVGAACSSKSSSQGSSSATSGAVAASTSATGVTAGAIRIGFSYPDLAALAKTGVIKVDNGPYDKVIKALVDDVNERGGINGRKLEPFTAKYDVLSNTPQITACTQLTEDDKVFAVLGGFIGDNNLCVTQQHATILVGAYSGFNQATLAKARAPWVIPGASDERSIKALVTLLAQQGRLKGHTVAIEGQTPDSKPLVDLTVKALDAAGTKAVSTAVIDVLASDTQAFNAQERVVAQRFRDEHADALILVGGTPQAANYDAVGWHPSIYVPSTSYVTPGAYTNPFDKFPFIGGLSVSADPDAGFNTPEMQRCRAVYQQATGIDIKTQREETALGHSTGNAAMQAACSTMQIFVDGAKAAGKDLNQQTWLKGVESIGRFSSPVAPVASFGPGKLDAQDTFQLEQHDPRWKPNSNIDEFIPIGAPLTLR